MVSNVVHAAHTSMPISSSPSTTTCKVAVLGLTLLWSHIPTCIPVAIKTTGHFVWCKWTNHLSWVSKGIQDISVEIRVMQLGFWQIQWKLLNLLLPPCQSPTKTDLMNNYCMSKEQYSHQMHSTWQHKTGILIQTSKNVMKTLN